MTREPIVSAEFASEIAISTFCWGLGAGFIFGAIAGAGVVGLVWWAFF